MTDPTKLAGRTVLLLWGWLVTDAVLAATSLWQIRVLGGLGGDVGDMDAVRASDSISLWSGILYLAVLLVTGVAVLRWIYVVNRNAHGWSDWMSVGPGWNVGSFFVPIIGFWRPFTGIRETWAVTIDPDAPELVPVPVWLRWWWGLWLATSMLGNASLRLSLRADTLAEFIVADWLNVVTMVLDLPLTILLVRLIRDVSALQHRHLRGPLARDDGDSDGAGHLPTSG